MPFLFAFFYYAAPSNGQGYITIVIDAKLMAEILINHGVTMSMLKPMEKATDEIRKYQEEIAAKTFVMRVIKDSLYQSLYEVSGIIKDGKNVLSANDLVNEIGRYQSEMARYAREDPELVVIAYKTEAALVSRSADLMSYIYSNALVGGDDNLINSKQRMQIIRTVIKELRTIRAMAYTVSVRMKIAARASAVDTIDPFNLAYPKRDAAIVEDILNDL